MADDLTEKLALLARLRKARFSGLRQIKFENREMTYRTDAELQAAIADLEAEIDALEGKTRSRTVLTTSFKGI